VDPIEKKPLYHFMPGTAIYSVGYLGCNLRCPFCQNHHISQSTTAASQPATADDIVAAAVAHGCQAIAHTYSEPLVHAEFVAAAMRAGRSAGLRNVLVSNGQCTAEVASELLANCDAVNVDLKSWDADFYRHELGGDLAETLSFIRSAFNAGVHVEVTSLIIPGRNDDDVQLDDLASFLADLSPAVVLHLSAYHPAYRYSIAPTPTSTLVRLSRIARRRLQHVYLGNIHDDSNDTHCVACGAVLVVRHGYTVRKPGLDGSRCRSCGAPSGIVV
jgi:pyruvate formate lyase activating enzyme